MKDLESPSNRCHTFVPRCCCLSRTWLAYASQSTNAVLRFGDSWWAVNFLRSQSESIFSNIFYTYQWIVHIYKVGENYKENMYLSCRNSVYRTEVEILNLLKNKKERGCRGCGGGLLSPFPNLQVKGSGNFARKAASAAAEIATGSSASGKYWLCFKAFVIFVNTMSWGQCDLDSWHWWRPAPMHIWYI